MIICCVLAAGVLENLYEIEPNEHKQKSEDDIQELQDIDTSWVVSTFSKCM